MSPKSFVILAAITLVAVVGAVFAVLTQPSATALELADEPAFPALREDPDAVAKIVITTPDGSITLVRETGDRWAALERYGYPVDRQRVRELVVTLADMRLIERKTSQPEYYQRLQVEDPSAENAKSYLVRLESADGAVLAEAIIGKQRHRLTGTEPSGTYLRRPGEAMSWLASGAVQIGEDVAAWLDDQIVDLNGDSIQRISIQPATGPSYVVERDEPGGELRLADLAAGEQAKEDADFARLTGAFSGVRLDDVKPRDQVSWPEKSHLAQVRTFDGLELTVRLAQIDDGHWAMFDARAIEPSKAPAEAAKETEATEDPQAPAAAAETEPGTAAETAGDDAPPAESASEAAATEGVEEVALEEETEAPPDPAELSKRLGKWAYQIPEYLFNRLTTERSEFLADEGGTS